MSETSIAFIVVHAGRDHPESKEILDIVEKSGITAITCVEINNKKTKQWLQHNTKKVKVTHLPSILIAQTGMDTLIYPGKAIHQIIETIRGMLPTD